MLVKGAPGVDISILMVFPMQSRAVLTGMPGIVCLWWNSCYSYNSLAAFGSMTRRPNVWPSIHFYNWFMSASLKYHVNYMCSNVYFDGAIRSQFSTCHDSCHGMYKIGTWWHCNFSYENLTKSGLSAHELFAYHGFAMKEVSVNSTSLYETN